MAKLDLQLGQTVFIETRNMFYNDKNRTVSEATIIDVNKSSAYAVSTYLQEKYPDIWKTERWMRDRIDLKTGTVKSSMAGDRSLIWLSKEEFEKSVDKDKENALLEIEAKRKFDSLSMKELKRFVEEF